MSAVGPGVGEMGIPEKMAASFTDSVESRESFARSLHFGRKIP